MAMHAGNLHFCYSLIYQQMQTDKAELHVLYNGNSLFGLTTNTSLSLNTPKSDDGDQTL